MNNGELPPKQPAKRRFLKQQPPARARVAPKREANVDDGQVGSEIIQRFRESRQRRPLRGASYSSTPSANPNEIGASCSRDGDQRPLCLPSPDMLSADAAVFSGSATAVTKNIKKDFIEPVDYDGHYMTILPLRKPFSGDPEMLDALEFGENQITQPNESCATHAKELGLDENCEKPELFFIQLPSKFPMPRRLFRAPQPDTSGSSMRMTKADASAKGKEKVTSPPVPRHGSLSAPRNIATAPRPARVPTERNPLEGISEGDAKILVYKSGKVKWKIGETLFDVAPGIHSENMAQDLAAVNTKEKALYEIGKLGKKMTVTADVDFLLDNVEGEIIRKRNHQK